MDEFIQPKIEGLITGLQPGGPVLEAIGEVRASLAAHSLT
jgi:hypothetical protein